VRLLGSLKKKKSDQLNVLTLLVGLKASALVDWTGQFRVFPLEVSPIL